MRIIRFGIIDSASLQGTTTNIKYEEISSKENINICRILIRINSSFMLDIHFKDLNCTEKLNFSVLQT